MIVRLDASEMRLVSLIAALWVANNASLRVKRYHGQTAFGYDDHIVGLIGELALAKASNQFWNGSIGNLRAKDVGRLQVRATTRPGGCLLLHPTDADDDQHFLVIVNDAVADIKGFILGRDGKARRYWRDNDPVHGIRAAYFVPQGVLEPVPDEWCVRVMRLGCGASNGAHAHA